MEKTIDLYYRIEGFYNIIESIHPLSNVYEMYKDCLPYLMVDCYVLTNIVYPDEYHYLYDVLDCDNYDPNDLCTIYRDVDELARIYREIKDYLDITFSTLFTYFDSETSYIIEVADINNTTSCSVKIQIY